MTDFQVDVSGLKRLSAVLRKVEPQLNRELFAGVAAGAELIAMDARQKAAFSSRIPRSIQVKRRGLVNKIQAGGDAAPHAAALEHGGVPGKFRHPVFGNREVWRDQAAHPFLTPAVNDRLDIATEMIGRAVDKALRGISVV